MVGYIPLYLSIGLFYPHYCTSPKIIGWTYLDGLNFPSNIVICRLLHLGKYPMMYYIYILPIKNILYRHLTWHHPVTKKRPGHARRSGHGYPLTGGWSAGKNIEEHGSSWGHHGGIMILFMFFTRLTARKWENEWNMMLLSHETWEYAYFLSQFLWMKSVRISSLVASIANISPCKFSGLRHIFCK